MNHSKFLNIIYVVGLLCVCLIVYVIVDSQSVLVSSDSPVEPYQHWASEDTTTSNETYEETQENIASYETNEQQQSHNQDTQTKQESQQHSDSGKSTVSQLILSLHTKDKTQSEPLDEPIESSKNTSSTSTTSSKTTSSKPGAYTGMVNLNTASFEQLCSLNGIGEVLAQRIIDYRKVKPFKTIEEIMEVSGIAEKKFAAIKDRITV